MQSQAYLENSWTCKIGLLAVNYFRKKSSIVDVQLRSKCFWQIFHILIVTLKCTLICNHNYHSSIFLVRQNPNFRKLCFQAKFLRKILFERHLNYFSLKFNSMIKKIHRENQHLVKLALYTLESSNLPRTTFLITAETLRNKFMA